MCEHGCVRACVRMHTCMSMRVCVALCVYVESVPFFEKKKGKTFADLTWKQLGPNQSAVS